MVELLDFLSLPDSVLCSVLCSALTFRDLLKLDSAYCNHNSRQILADLFCSKQFVFENGVPLFYGSEIYWLQRKSMKASYLVVNSNTNNAELTRYLRANGGSVRKFCLHSNTTAQTMATIALYCRNIAELHVTESTLTSAFIDIIWNSPNLRILHCLRVKCAEPNLLAGVSMHKQQHNSIDYGESQVGFPWSATTYSDSLRTVLWDCCDFTLDDLNAIVAYCPQLRSLSCGYVYKQYLGAIAPKLSRLYNLSIGGNHFVTDADLLLLVQNITTLRTLNIELCRTLTSKSLLHIAEHAGDTLEVLYADLLDPDNAETERILEIFAQKCTKLRYLNIN